MLHRIFFTLLIAFPIFSHAQDSNLGNWIIYFGNKQINNKWNWHHEVQYRNYNFIGDLEQLLLRTGFGYNLSENSNNILLGYGYILSENYISGTNEKTSVSENRCCTTIAHHRRYRRLVVMIYSMRRIRSLVSRLGQRRAKVVAAVVRVTTCSRFFTLLLSS